MDRYERTLLKQQGEYIYARICCKIAAVLNEKHKSEGHQPDFIIYKAIEFTTKSKVCLERFDKTLWNDMVHIAIQEFRQLTNDEKEACRVYIDELEDENLTDREVVIDICSEFETRLEHWAFEYVEEEMLNGRMSKKEGNKILFANTRGDSPFPFIDDDDDWNEEDDKDEIWDKFDRLRDDLDNEEIQDQELPFSGKANVVNPKFHS